MASKLEKILANVLIKTTPSSEKKKRVSRLAETLRKRVEEIAQKAELNVEVRIEGSIAKNTWLSESPDIDIFIRVPSSVPREAFGTAYLDVARKATKGAKQIERFAEHPYLEAILENTRVNIVPCYCVNKDEWKSATDRTPFHTDYVKLLLNEKLCGEIRLLKQFMKGIGVYGAEIKVGGFSGYLCELLILSRGSFIKVIEAACEWKPKILIDLEGYYEGCEHEIELLFEEPLVIVDPVDKRRNVASAVRKARLDEFIAASRALLGNPSEEFFYPTETKPFGLKQLSEALRSRGSSMIFIQVGKIKTVPDVLWGQLYRSQRALRKLVKQHDFKILRDTVWSDEKNLNILLLEVEHQCVPPLKKHFGPPLEKRSECDDFLKKHTTSKRTLSGPRIEEGRWVVEMTRVYTDLVFLLKKKLADGGRNVGFAELISKAIARELRILINEEILPSYSKSMKFALFLTEYLRGKPRWLNENHKSEKGI